MVHSLASNAGSPGTAPSGTSSPNDSLKVPSLNEMYLLNAQCARSIEQEVQCYFKSYKEFVNCKNDRLKVIISALNVANVGRYIDLRIKYPGFMLELPPVDINKLVQEIQTAYPAQVVQYSLGASKKDETKASDAETTGSKDSNIIGLFPQKGKDQAGLFPPNSCLKNITNLMSI